MSCQHAFWKEQVGKENTTRTDWGQANKYWMEEAVNGTPGTNMWKSQTYPPSSSSSSMGSAWAPYQDIPSLDEYGMNPYQYQPPRSPRSTRRFGQENMPVFFRRSAKVRNVYFDPPAGSAGHSPKNGHFVAGRIYGTAPRPHMMALREQAMRTGWHIRQPR